MSNLGVIDADPSEPPSNEEVIRLANRLLSEFNIPTTIEDVGDICAALFVLLYENLFSERLSGIIRQPVSKEDEIHNCQTVIDVLSTDIVRDSLSHIRGVDIVDGDITAISNLLDIFSYLLDYVANRIESDIATDNEDAKSWNNADQESDLSASIKKNKSYQQQRTLYSWENRSPPSRSVQKKPLNSKDQREGNGRKSPSLNINDNHYADTRCDKYFDLARPGDTSPTYKEVDSLRMQSEGIEMPPSPIRPDQSQSLLGQKTIDSTELESQYGKDDGESLKGSFVPKVAWGEKPADFDRKIEFKGDTDDNTDGVVGVGVSATTDIPPRTGSTAAAATTIHDLETDVLRPRGDRGTNLSASMPPPQKSTGNEEHDSRFRSTVGPIDYHTPRTPEKDYAERNHDPTLVKGLSSSYNDLRQLVERTAAMTRVALQTSPIIDRTHRDMTDLPRPTIPSDGARLAKELNARAMRKGMSHTSPTRGVKKVAFSSFTDDALSGRSRSSRHRYPLEELSDNDYTIPYNGKGPGKGRCDYDGSRREDYKSSRPKSTSPDGHTRTKKTHSTTEAFAKHLARSRQPELGAAHLNLRTEDRAIKKKQDFLERLYHEDLGEFSEDVQFILGKDQKASREMEKQMLKSYQDSKPLVKGVKKSKSTSTTSACKKPKLGSKVVSSKAKRSPRVQKRSTASPPLKLESEEDLFPFLLEEFPHLHLSDHTWHELCRKGLHQIEGITRVYQENKRKKSRAQIQLEEAAQRHELLSDIMRKELDHTKRVRELKEQRVQQVQLKNKSHEKRVQSARARRYYNDYQVRARSKQLKRRTREEMVFRDLFKDAMKIQKERIKDIRQYSSDQRKCQEIRRQNEMESMENFYQDQFQMLAEKLAQERKDNNLRDKAQQQMVERIKRELRKKIESEICLYQEQMFRDDDDAHFRQMDADHVKRQLHMARYAAQI